MKESFEDFKRLIKEWLDTHPKEYCSFVEEMNRKDNTGFQKGLYAGNKVCTEIQRRGQEKNVQRYIKGIFFFGKYAN